MNKVDFQLEQGERQMAIAGGVAHSSCKAVNGNTSPSDCSALIRELGDMLDMLAQQIEDHCDDPANALPSPDRIDDWLTEYRTQYRVQTDKAQLRR